MDESATKESMARAFQALSHDHGRTYEVRTFGCQMNVHDSERMSGSLESAGYHKAEGDQVADVVVINT